MASRLFTYGTQSPSGEGGVRYIYSEDGTWKSMAPLEYLWNYYDYANLPPEHPYDKSRLIAYSDGTHFTTCLDANRHLLCDFQHDGTVRAECG